MDDFGEDSAFTPKPDPKVEAATLVQDFEGSPSPEAFAVPAGAAPASKAVAAPETRPHRALTFPLASLKPVSPVMEIPSDNAAAEETTAAEEAAAQRRFTLTAC